jgi:hypothetical protein|tara:strand:+ start:437 stop:802 length:366 start_codon:yes stop_codon:yes gene_type:complete
MDKVKQTKIDGSIENWESGMLGNDEEFAKIADEITSQKADEMLALQMISIRLQKSMIRDLKFIAKVNGIGGYQPLIRRLLVRFVDAEMKSIAKEASSQQSYVQDEDEADVLKDAPKEQLRA